MWFVGIRGREVMEIGERREGYSLFNAYVLMIPKTKNRDRKIFCVVQFFLKKLVD